MYAPTNQAKIELRQDRLVLSRRTVAAPLLLFLAVVGAYCATVLGILVTGALTALVLVPLCGMLVIALFVIGHDACHQSYRECQKFCVTGFCEGGFPFWYIDTAASTARPASLLGRAEQSSPAPLGAPLCGSGLDGEGAGQAIIDAAVMSVLSVIGLFLKSAHRIEWQTGPLQLSIPSRVANACRHF
jgi:hypothetical protein